MAGLHGVLDATVGLALQVLASNAEMLERKKADEAERAAEDRRIVAYLREKAAREQVPAVILSPLPMICLTAVAVPFVLRLLKPPFVAAAWCTADTSAFLCASIGSEALKILG